jgi:hypothetical protein
MRLKISLFTSLVVIGGLILWMGKPTSGGTFDQIPEVTPCDHTLPPIVEEAERYASAQIEFAGEWASEDCSFLFYAFTDNLAEHRAALARLGVDMDSGRYQLIQVQFTLGELSTARNALTADLEQLAIDWGVVFVGIDTEANRVIVAVDWDSDSTREAQLLADLSARYHFGGFAVVTGASKPTFDTL